MWLLRTRQHVYKELTWGEVVQVGKPATLPHKPSGPSCAVCVVVGNNMNGPLKIINYWMRTGPSLGVVITDMLEEITL